MTKWIKVRTQKPCTQCGECCKQWPCNLAGGHNPCLALRANKDGTYSCLLVERNIPNVREYLLVGYGCGATLIPAGFKRKVLDRMLK